MSLTLRLGTRRSLLARSQSAWVAREIERLNPGARVELVGIDTRGDRIVDVPLRSVEGKEFFVAELDEALTGGRVDLTVHSMKDLSLERPAGIARAAVPRRENPRDVAIFGPGAMAKLRAGRKLVIGTSSPRRAENLPPFLARVLPFGGRVELVELRGNVNTRLGRLREPEGSERALDGVVLAFAGLIRLKADAAEGSAELSRLLRGLRWMVLPLRENAAAPAQGVLAVECRAGDARVLEALRPLHDPASAEAADAERAWLERWGGGCHQRFGATQVAHPELGQMLFLKGRKPDGETVDELIWSPPPLKAHPVGIRAWDGSAQEGAKRAPLSVVPAEGDPERWKGRSVFVAHSRAVNDTWASMLEGARVWVSGVSSWERLAAQGVWVEGCAEGLGYSWIEPVLREPVLGLAPLEGWAVLTHRDAAAGWPPSMEVISTYAVSGDEPAGELSGEAREEIARATHLFWSSGSQWARLGGLAAAGAHHACGPGKTAARLREVGLKPDVFPSAEEWRKWIKR